MFYGFPVDERHADGGTPVLVNLLSILISWTIVRLGFFKFKLQDNRTPLKLKLNLILDNSTTPDALNIWWWCKTGCCVMVVAWLRHGDAIDIWWWFVHELAPPPKLTDQSERLRIVTLSVTDTGSSPKSLLFYYIWIGFFNFHLLRCHGNSSAWCIMVTLHDRGNIVMTLERTMEDDRNDEELQKWV